MKNTPLLVLGLCVLACGASSLIAAPRAVIRVSNPDASAARPGEVVVVPFAEVRKLVPDVRMYHLDVKDAKGARVAAQVTNFNPDDRRALYDDLVFQHDFAAGETEAVFTLETTDTPVPPFPTLVTARYVPERLDDFAWENDRIGHRIYGPGLTTAAAGPGTRMISSGIDVWCKKVRYPIVDRWYTKGHDAYHVDTGEGQDLYSVGTARGCGGTGIWEGDRLWVSRNWQTQKVLANGPIRAVFELGYDTWQAGPRWVTESKRFTVDAGRNLDAIVSTFDVQRGAEIVVAVGIAKPGDAKVGKVLRDEKARVLSVWQTYEKGGSSIGCGIVLPPEVEFAGFAEDAQNYLILAKVKSGAPFRHFAGAGWDRSGDFADVAAWEAYLTAFAARLKAPVTATIAAAP
ncbi:MAG: DUF4861 family protein [Opitutaceae bacterium]|nr:DUF4861 family protein [Opitutaceae bacterium]